MHKGVKAEQGLYCIPGEPWYEEDKYTFRIRIDERNRDIILIVNVEEFNGNQVICFYR